MSQTRQPAQTPKDTEQPLSRLVLRIPAPLKWALRERAARQQTTMGQLVLQILESEVAA